MAPCSRQLKLLRFNNRAMSTTNVKTRLFRNILRQTLLDKEWQKCQWANHILAAECVQGWAGRKQPEKATMLRVYSARDIGAVHTTNMAAFLQDSGLPPFNLIPIRGYRQEIEANRLPTQDTQDRFWLLRNYNALDATHWDHWLLTKMHWGGLFQPSAQQAMTIVNDIDLFNTMLTHDWSRQDHFGEPSTWAAAVSKYHEQWPNYSAMVQLLGTLQSSTFEEFRSTHLSLRAGYLNPQPVESFDLP